MATNGTPVTPSTSPIAIVTGGASGMGLSIVRRLLELSYHVTIVDFNPAPFATLSKQLGPSATFTQADVTSYDDLCNIFSTTFKQFGRIDVVYANAGVGDQINFYAPATNVRSDGAPEKPNVKTIDTCLMGVVWCAYLALHYFRMNANKKAKFVATSSECGLYPGDDIPLYTAAKHGVVGLCRALGKHCKLAGEDFQFNAICPGLVDTGLTGRLMAACPPQYVTPHSTIVKAFEMFLDDDGLTALAAECSGENVYMIDHQKWSDEIAKFVMDHGLDAYLKKLM